MRMIDGLTAEAFLDNRNWHQGNTLVRSTLAQPQVPSVTELLLHGHTIASWCPRLGSFYTTMAGYSTVTTRSRANSLILAMHEAGHIPHNISYSVKAGQSYWGSMLISPTAIQWHTPHIYGVEQQHPGLVPAAEMKQVPQAPVLLVNPVTLTLTDYMEVLL